MRGKPMKKSFRLISLFAFLFSLSFVSLFQHPTLAQDPGTEEERRDTGAEELSIEEKGFYELESTINMKVDVASLFEEDELVVGSSVSSVDESAWNRLGARYYYEVLNNEPGVFQAPIIWGQHYLFVRGYASKNVYGVDYLIDGVPMLNFDLGSAALMFARLDTGILDRVEMIKGPGSAIYGSDAFHGVVSMKTFESDRNTYRFQANIAYPLWGGGNVKISQGNDKVRMDFAASGTYQGNQNLEYHYLDLFGVHMGTNSVSLPTWAGTGTYRDSSTSGAGVLKLRIMPTDRLTFRLGGYVLHTDMRGINGNVYLTATTDDPIVNARDHDQYDTRSFFTMATGAVEYKFRNKISIEGSGYYWYNFKYQDGYATPFPWDHYQFTDRSYRAGARVILKQPDNSIRLQWLVAYESSFMGIPEAHNDLKIRTPNPVVSPANYRIPSMFDEANRVIHSAFAQFKWNAVKDILYFILGGRLDYYYNQYGLQATPRAGIIVKPADSMAIKLLYGRAFRAPDAVARNGVTMAYLGSKGINPETIDIGELVYIFKFQKNLKLNVTGFYTYWRNAIDYFRTTALKPYFQSIYLNRGNNRSYGGEMSLNAAFKRWGGNAGFAYARGEALNAFDPLSQAANLANPRFPIMKKKITNKAYPAYSIIAGIFYTIPVIDVTAFVNNRIYFDMYECMPNFDTQVTAKRLPVYYRLDLNLSRVIAEKLELILDIRNLLNRKNYLPSVWGQEDGCVEPGISAMLRVSYKI
jgi:outer membrane cobalamin receptor